jgi:nicotinamidase-related amidase
MFALPALQPHEGEATVARIAGLIARARAANAPIFFVQHDGGPDDAFHPGKPGFDMHPAIAPRAGDDITVKRFSSAFHATDVDAKLKRAAIEHLVVTGMQSEYCVDSAMRSAYERGYRLTLASDAHSTFDTRAAKAPTIIAIQNDTMQGSFAEVMPAAQLVF